jgi:hypothetical protein
VSIPAEVHVLRFLEPVDRGQPAFLASDRLTKRLRDQRLQISDGLKRSAAVPYGDEGALRDARGADGILEPFCRRFANGVKPGVKQLLERRFVPTAQRVHQVGTDCTVGGRHHDLLDDKGSRISQAPASRQLEIFRDAQRGRPNDDGMVES